MKTDDLDRRAAPIEDSLASAIDWIRGAERHLAALQTAYEDSLNKPDLILPSQKRLSDDRNGQAEQMEELALGQAGIQQWIRSAETHLAALQAERERLVVSLQQNAEDRAGVQQWMRNVEAHLAALQGDHDRVSALSHHHQVVARLTLLETYLGDLERSDTEIAAALAEMRAGDHSS